MSDFAPPTIAPQNIAPAQDDGTIPPVPEAPEPAPITEQEVGEYREQDRFLPVRAPSPHPPSQARSLNVRLSPSGGDAEDRERLAHHEGGGAGDGEDLEGGEGVRAGVRVRIHLLHHVRGGGEVPDGEAQDDRRRGHPLRHGHARVRKLRRVAQDPSIQVAAGAYIMFRAPWRDGCGCGCRKTRGLNLVGGLAAAGWNEEQMLTNGTP